MPTLETGTETDLAPSRAYRGQAGFTLVEVLLVVFIVGLSTTLVIMNIPPGPERIEAAAAEIEADMEALRERAIVTGILHGVEVHDDRYEVVRRVEGAWVEDRTLGRDLEPPLSLVAAASREDRADGPVLVFDPAGLQTSAVLTITDGAARRDIRVGPDVGASRR